MQRSQPIVAMPDPSFGVGPRADSLARTTGFTVIELLVVLAAIAILSALVLPAVQHVREDARQVHCRNNLHQIGVALQSYHATTTCYPPGWILETPLKHDSQNGWGWLAMLLAQVEHGAAYNRANFHQHVGNATNHTARLATVEAFLCVSDRVPARVPFYLPEQSSSSLSSAASNRASPSLDGLAPRHANVLFEVAGASYVGVYGTNDPPDDAWDSAGNGVFWLNSKTRLGDLIDGAAQTLIAGERSVRRLAATWTGIHPSEVEGPERVIGLTIHRPNRPEADEAEFSSRHPGGVHFLLGDGSVRFLSEHIDPTVYQALGTRSGSEQVGHNEF
jgi:prepilin-type N-terminal cleavage/methylation domain-containing protein/prepilin-type processing-associated H-X9-DG protein